MRLEPPAQLRPPGVVEERERQVGLEDRVADLGGVELHVHRERPLLRGPVRPLRPLARLLQAADGGQRLRADEQRQVEAACPDLPGHLGGQHVGHRPSDARVAPPRRRRAQSFGEPAHRVVVLPGLRVDDVDALEAAEDGRPARRGGPGIVRRRARHPFPHVERLGRRATGGHDVGVVGVPGVAGDADDAGGPRVGAQGCGRQARDLPGMAMARSAMMFFWISVEPPPIVE